VALGGKPVVVVVARVAVPDELDTEDLVVRDGSVLRRSASGRWATRLSLGLTDRLTARLAADWPDAVVTDRPLGGVVSDRLLVNISRLDVTGAGIAMVDADWRVVPVDPARAVTLRRTRFSVTGPVGTDQAVVTLIGRVTDRLADAIDAPDGGGGGVP
jgi:uncharacterized lipoprotein YmbA